MKSNPLLKFNDGHAIPQIGFGLWQMSDDEATRATSEAFAAGYRSIDGASIYRNETGLGRALKETDLKRSEFFITTKLWNESQGYDSTLKAFDTSLSKLGLDEVDLYLIHWPSPHRNLFVETWKAFVQLKKDGRAKSIGVSNFRPDDLRKIIDATGVTPVINQIELHPQFQQHELRAFHKKNGILTESWSPLGQGQLLSNTTLKTIAARHHKTPAQVIIRWHLQSGLVAIPKSVTPSRIRENFNVFDFELDASDMKTIDSLDQPTGRIGPDPATAQF